MSHFEDETQPEPICAACNKPWPCPDASHEHADGCPYRGPCTCRPATPAPLAPHPGRNHEYRMTCLSCGEPGHLFVGFCSPGETFTWSGAQPKEADRE